MIVPINEIGFVCESIRKNSKKIVFTNGCFDILHYGHISYLKQAKSLGDILIVGLNSDASVRRIKGNQRPIIPEIERGEILDSIKPVDYVVIFEEDTPENLIHIVKPDSLVKGGDYKVEDVVGARFVQSYGGKVVILPYIQGNSTTDIIQKIKNL